MHIRRDDTAPRHDAARRGLDAWENEGGALRHDGLDHQYGRRVEADGMLSLNGRKEARRRGEPGPAAATGTTTGEGVR